MESGMQGFICPTEVNRTTREMRDELQMCASKIRDVRHYPQFAAEKQYGERFKNIFVTINGSHIVITGEEKGKGPCVRRKELHISQKIW